MKIKNITTTLLAGAFACCITTPVLAEQPNSVNLQIQQRIETNKSVKNEISTEIKTNMASKTGIIRKLIDSRAALVDVTVKSKTDTSLSVEKDGKTYIVNTDEKTQFRRRYWGKSDLEEIQIGDKLNVIGTWTDEGRTTILARLIRDLSVQVRFGVFIGTVESVSDSGFTFKTVNRDTQTVIVSTSTKYVNRKEMIITKNDITVGHRVRVKGLWNKTHNTVTEVKQVKDYDLPARVTPSESPKAKPSATPTVEPSTT